MYHYKFSLIFSLLGLVASSYTPPSYYINNSETEHPFYNGELCRPLKMAPRQKSFLKLSPRCRVQTKRVFQTTGILAYRFNVDEGQCEKFYTDKESTCAPFQHLKDCRTTCETLIPSTPSFHHPRFGLNF